MAEEKVTTMELKVDLQCSKCYKKVKKLLCKFPEIREQTFDEKAKTVTIKVVSSSPEKIRDKLLYKGCGCIKSIVIKKKPEKEKPKDPVKVSVDVQVQGFFYCKFCSGRPRGPCSCGWRGPCFCGGRGLCDPCYGRPVCDSWCAYGSGCEETQPGCSFM